MLKLRADRSMRRRLRFDGNVPKSESRRTRSGLCMRLSRVDVPMPRGGESAARRSFVRDAFGNRSEIHEKGGLRA